jgi:hypothetical protein
MDPAMVAASAALALVIVIGGGVMLLLRRTRRRVAALEAELDRLRRHLDLHPPPLAQRPVTERYTPRGTQRLPEPSPQANQRLPDTPTPRGTQRLPDPQSPRGTQRLPERSPLGSTRIPEPSPRAQRAITEGSPRGVPRLGEGTPSRGVPQAGAGWAPTHRITFTPEHGRGETWLVMMTAGPDGARNYVTKAEWSAGVVPAWRCALDGSWSHHGQRTPAGAKGKVSVEEYRG